MAQVVCVRRLAAGSVFKLLAIGLTFSLVPFSVLAGIMAQFGVGIVIWNGQPLSGFAALIASPFIGLFLALLFSIPLGIACVFGLWLFSRFLPLRLTMIRAEPTPPTDSQG